MRSPRTNTLLAIALPLIVLGFMGIASDVGRDRSFFAPDATMWSVNWPSYVCLITASILLLFVSVRAILRSLQR